MLLISVTLLFSSLFRLIGREARTFPVHRSILIGRSEVFAAMIEGNALLEKNKSVLTIKDISQGPLYEMLRFLYTDQVSSKVVTVVINNSKMKINYM